MKVPKHIQHKMRRIVELQLRSSCLMHDVEEWFLLNGFSEEDLESGGILRCGDGVSLEELEYGIDVVDLIVKKVEEM